MALTIAEYAEYLHSGRADLSWPAPPDVVPAKAKPGLARLPDVRVVVWNVYGTLVNISGAQLYLEHPQKLMMEVALDKTLQEFKMWGSMSRKPGQPAEYLGQLYTKALDEQRTAPSPGEKYPEFLSEIVWESIVRKLLQKDYQFDVSFYGSLNELCRKISYFFHASLQGTTCYDGAAKVLQTVRKMGLKQGLLGNGQVFTTVQLDRGLQEQDEDGEFVKLFDPNLIVLSHQLRGRKPSERLFREFYDRVEPEGIMPEQILHVGNSIEQDIIPAKRLGWKTALFAGDKNSLQATPEQLKTPASKPDLLVTELSQLRKVFPR